MLSSGAELSHCEQRGNQSLFTNQLSSEPGWRGADTKKARPHKNTHQGPPAPSSTALPLQSAATIKRLSSIITSSSRRRRSSGRSRPRRGRVVIPGNVIFIISHKSARQEPSRPRHEGGGAAATSLSSSSASSATLAPTCHGPNTTFQFSPPPAPPFDSVSPPPPHYLSTQSAPSPTSPQFPRTFPWSAPPLLFATLG